MLSNHSEDEDEEVLLDATGMVLTFLCFKESQPQHTSILTGAMRFEEYMTTENENDFFDNVKMNKEDSFIPLVDLLTTHGGLTDGKEVSAVESENPCSLKIDVFILQSKKLRSRSQQSRICRPHGAYWRSV